MSEPVSETSGMLVPRLLSVESAGSATWSVYVVRVDLSRFGQGSAIKVGMVGTGTIDGRMKQHQKQFGPTEVLYVWTLAPMVDDLDELQSWRAVEQYEARLQFAPEFLHPHLRLRQLRPDTRVFSFEWFDDDDRVLNAVRAVAANPVLLPSGWTIADPTQPTEILTESPLAPDEPGPSLVSKP